MFCSHERSLTYLRSLLTIGFVYGYLGWLFSQIRRSNANLVTVYHNGKHIHMYMYMHTCRHTCCFLLAAYQISSDNDQHLLQEDMDTLSSWENLGEWSSIHRNVVCIMHIARARTPRAFQYHLKGVPLTEEQSSEYLRWTYTPKVQLIVEKSHKPHQQKVLQCNLRQASEETKDKAYFNMVQSNLDYCCTI